jgi:hypothetical protein
MKMLLNAVLLMAVAGPAAAWWDVYVTVTFAGVRYL